MHVFITGTGTGVGKTYVTCLLVKALRNSGQSAMGYKPICCGDREDAEQIRVALGEGGPDIETINPLWLKVPAAPYAAGMIENRPVDVDELAADWTDLARAHPNLLVEGVGGWEVPLTKEETMADLVERMQIPVIVVVDNRLGALNHTLLTVRNIQDRGLKCLGLVINQVDDERDSASISNLRVLQDVCPTPVISELFHGQDALDWPPEIELS